MSTLLNPEQNIREVVVPINEPEFETAVGRWEARFTNRTIDCTCFRGYRGAEGDVECDVKGCHQGEIEALLCVRCENDEHGCSCTAEQFLNSVL